MKQTLYISFLALSATVCVAQPTLTLSGLNPVVGDKFLLHSVDTSTLPALNTGAGVVWDYSGISYTNLDSTKFVACNTTPFCDSFPGSDIVQTTGNTYVYAKTSADSFYIIGQVNGTNFSRLYDYRKSMVFPFSYNQTYTDTSHYKLGAEDIFFFDSAIADGYGTLYLPDDTIYNALRVHYINITRRVLGTTTITEWRFDRYRWFMNDFHSSVLTIMYDTMGTGIPKINSATVSSKNIAPTSIGNYKTLGLNIQLYPTPANNEVVVTSSIGTIFAITVKNLQGQVLSEKLYTDNPKETRLNTNILSNGIYVIVIQTSQGVISQQLIVQH